MEDEESSEIAENIKKQVSEWFDPSPHEISLPQKFLYNMYQRGYDIVWKKYGDLQFFTLLADELKNIGLFTDGGEKLKEKLLRYERENIDNLVGSPFMEGVGIGFFGERRDRREVYLKHVEELELNNRVFGSIDLHCISNIFNVDIGIFSVDYSSPMMLGFFKYKSDRGDSKDMISFVIDPSKFPVWIYRTKVVHMEKMMKNPYDVKEVTISNCEDEGKE